MPIDLTISSAVTPLATADRTPPPPANQTLQPAAPAAAGAKASGPPPPSPTLRFDAAADMLVIEFHNDAGAVTDSIPTQQQLEAYRSQAEYGSPPSPQLAPTHQAASTAGGNGSPAAAGPAIGA